MKELSLTAAVENLQQVLSFVEEGLEKLDCPMKIQVQMAIAVEEIYVNIAHYAYVPDVGPVTIQMELDETGDQARITFIDRGRPYDPLAREDPDITLAAEDREIGGLGILMVKRSMDDMFYEYKDGCNILTIKKKW